MRRMSQVRRKTMTTIEFVPLIKRIDTDLPIFESKGAVKCGASCFHPEDAKIAEKAEPLPRINADKRGSARPITKQHDVEQLVMAASEGSVTSVINFLAMEQTQPAVHSLARIAKTEFLPPVKGHRAHGGNAFAPSLPCYRNFLSFTLRLRRKLQHPGPHAHPGSSARSHVG